MRKYIKQLVIIVITTIYSLGFVVPAVQTLAATTPATTAQNTSKNGQALEIAPPVIYLSVDPGQTVKTQISIRDISSGNLVVKGQVNNFVAGGEDGTPKVILDTTTTTADDPYELVNWVTPLPSLVLVPREIKTMAVTINVPKDASPGGHYGVIRFTSNPPSVEGSGVSLSASIGVLLLLTVSGKINQNLTVDQFTVSGSNKKPGSFFESGPLNFTEKLKNTGNVHVQPVGQVTITDMFGKKLASVNVNLPPGNVLPNSTRAFTQPLDKTVIGSKLLFGRYKAALSVKYGDNKTAVGNIEFWVIPYKLIALVIALIIAAFFALRYAIKRYNRYIVSQLQKRK